MNFARMNQSEAGRQVDVSLKGATAKNSYAKLGCYTFDASAGRSKREPRAPLVAAAAQSQRRWRRNFFIKEAPPSPSPSSPGVSEG